MEDFNEDQFIVDQFTYSFSKLNAYYHCGHEFYRRYIECEKTESSFFSEFGSYVHKILEKYYNCELSLFELSGHYEECFDENIKHTPPPNKYVDLKEVYYQKGLDFFNNLADFDFDTYEILGVEKEIHFTIAEKEFIGFIDLLLREKATGNIIMRDHKSASIKFLKNGQPSKKDVAHVLEFKRQQYIYSKAVKDEYETFPKTLQWNLFKDQYIYQIEFNEEEYNDAIRWAEETIDLISKECMWLPDNSNYFYCNHLCGYRNAACDYKAVYVKQTEEGE